MTKILFAAASLAALVGASAAQAQTSDWSGAYIGASAGYIDRSGHGGESILFDTNRDGNFDNNVNTAAGANAFSPGFCDGTALGATPAAGCRKNENGPDFGLRLGYDWQFGNFVVGPVAEITRTDVKDSVSAFSTTPAAYTMERKLHGLAAIRLRGGYAFGDNLIYATGGYARGDFKRRFATTNTANQFPVSGGKEPDGYQFGAGVERKIAANVTLGAEWIYTKLDDKGYRATAVGPAPAGNPFLLVNASGTDLMRSDDKFDFNTFRLTANYRF